MLRFALTLKKKRLVDLDKMHVDSNKNVNGVKWFNLGQ